MEPNPNPGYYPLDLDPKVNHPKGLDLYINLLDEGGSHYKLLVKIADHYGVGYEKLRDLLLARQLVLINALTDYDKTNCEADLQQLLMNMNSNVSDIIDRMSKRVGQLDQALRDTELIRDEAARVLAEYKARYLRDSPPV